MSSATIALHKLCDAAAYGFPLDVQERLALLQTKNNEGALTEAEAAELQALVNEYNVRTLEKAQALLELRRCGADTGDNSRSRTRMSLLSGVNASLHALGVAVNTATHRSPW